MCGLYHFLVIRLNELTVEALVKSVGAAIFQLHVLERIANRHIHTHARVHMHWKTASVRN